MFGGSAERRTVVSRLLLLLGVSRGEHPGPPDVQQEAGRGRRKRHLSLLRNSRWTELSLPTSSAPQERSCGHGQRPASSPPLTRSEGPRGGRVAQTRTPGGAAPTLSLDSERPELRRAVPRSDGPLGAPLQHPSSPVNRAPSLCSRIHLSLLRSPCAGSPGTPRETRSAVRPARTSRDRRPWFVCFPFCINPSAIPFAASGR